MAPVAPGATAPVELLGRRREQARLEEALERATTSGGSAWVVRGPAGMGKTRLLRWLEHRAEERGFLALWGYAMQDVASPFFVIDQLFARLAAVAGPTPTFRGELPTLLLVEGAGPEAVLERCSGASAGARLLVISREMPARLRARHPGLPPDARVLWLTRAEGPENLPPGDLEMLGERITHFWEESPGSSVAVAGLEYLVSQHAFAPVLKLVQYLRDVAETHDGHLLLGVAPSTLEPRERALLAAEGELETAAPSTEVASADLGSPPEEEPVALRLLRYSEQLERTSRDRPLLLLLDDLQWVDPSSLVAFRFLLRSLPSRRVLVGVTLRSEGKGIASPDVRATLEAAERSGQLRSLTLDGLDPEDSAALAEGPLPHPIRARDRAAWRKVLAPAGGNPYFLLETGKHLLREGRLTVEGGEMALDPRAEPVSEGEPPTVGGIPPSLARLVSSRVQALPAELVRLLEVASLAGSHLPERSLSGALGTPLPAIEVALRRLEEEALVEEDPREPGGWSFHHPYVWEVVRSQIDPVRTAREALPLARWWASHRPHEVEQVARLFHLSGEAEGIPWTRRASDRALRLHAGEAAERYVSWTLDLLGDRPEHREERGWERTRLIMGLLVGGQGERASHLVDALLGEELPEELRWYAELLRVDILGDADIDAGRRALVELERRWPDPDDSLAPKVRLYRACVEGSTELLRPDGGRAAEVAGAALAWAPPDSDPEVIGRLYDAWGWGSLGRGDLPSAERAFREGRRVTQEQGLLGLEAYHLNGLGTVALRRDQLTLALALYEDAAETSRRAGDFVNYAIHAVFVVQLADLLRGPGTTRPLEEEVEKALQRLDLPEAERRISRELGDVALLRGDLLRARALLRPEDEEMAMVGSSTDLGRRTLAAELLAREGHAGRGEALLRSVEGHQGTTRLAAPKAYLARARGWLAVARGDPAGASDALAVLRELTAASQRGFERWVLLEGAVGLAMGARASPQAAELSRELAEVAQRLRGPLLPEEKG